MDSYSHIIVGAGSAGCVLAARLSENPSNRILLIEAGGRDHNPMFHIPLGSGKLLRTGLYGWGYRTEPDPATANRELLWPRARVVGGCSSINGMVYVRGAPEDFDAWAASGNAGWSFAEVLPYFLRSEHHFDRSGPFHGVDGELAVTTGASSNPLYEAFLSAATEAGHPTVSDFNGGRREGFGRFDFNIQRGRRSSASTAFLSPALKRPNLRLVTRANVTRLLFDGRKVTGVEFSVRRTMKEASAQEVILCAGTVNSPKLLLQSGIGDPAQLMPLDINVRHALPGVGRNLHDHAVVALRYACPQPITLHSLIRLDRAALAMARAWLLRSGPATSFPTEAGGFTRSDASQPIADLQWHFTVGLGSSRLRIPYLHPLRPGPYERDGFTIGVFVLRPKSHGTIRLRNADPYAAPLIEPRYLHEPDDIKALREGVRQVRQIASQPALAPFVSGELSPGPSLVDDETIDRWIRASVESAHHQAGTCKMGNDSEAVVGSNLKVHGIEGLRVADASIMPTVVGANTNAATIMIAEKAADMILGRSPPQSLHIPS